MNVSTSIKRAESSLRREFKDIPPAMIKEAKGLVFLTLLKGAFLWGGQMAFGVLMRRLTPTTWSPPSSVGLGGAGIGLQIGGQIVDVVIILTEESEVDAFASKGSLKLGVDYGISLGPKGRDVDIAGVLGSKGTTGAFSYSKSKGAFVGCSFDGSVLIGRSRANRIFYKTNGVSISDVLHDRVKIPPGAAANRFESLQECLYEFQEGRLDSHVYTFDDGGDERGNTAVYLPEDQDASDEALVQQAVEEDRKEKARQEAAQSGRDLLVDIMSDAPAQKSNWRADEDATEGVTYAEVVSPHVVDERSPSIARYGIISLNKHDQVEIVQGDLVRGMGGKYADYVKVKRVADGKSGLVSRLVLEERKKEAPTFNPYLASDADRAADPYLKDQRERVEHDWTNTTYNAPNPYAHRD